MTSQAVYVRIKGTNYTADSNIIYCGCNWSFILHWNKNFSKWSNISCIKCKKNVIL